MSAIKDQYLNTILKEIRFPFDRKIVQKELEAHLEESIDYYLKPGITIEEAETSAIQDFGDPGEIGRMLNKVHKPFLGWLWIISKYSFIVLLIVSVIISTPRLTEAYQKAQESKAPTEEASIILNGVGVENGIVVLDKMLDQRVKVKDATIIFERVIVLEDGILILLVQQVDKFNPFGLEPAEYPLRSQGTLLWDGTTYMFRQSGLMAYSDFMVLIAEGLPKLKANPTFVFTGYSEEFSLDLELDHD